MTKQYTTKINSKNLNEKVIVFGWVKTIRKLGEVVFFDLRDIDGILQVVVEKTNANFEVANTLRNEYVIKLEGTVSKRKSVNANIYSGGIEIIPSSITLISKAETTPLIIDNETDALEPIRLEYKYLDIRRPNITRNLIFRSEFNKIVRNYFYDLNFKEIETPTITKPTPGGAGEFAVVSLKKSDQYSSLVQSPQIYKQLLMYGGIDKYFQIARCYRDEASRSDRQPEFTQLDLEMLWINENEIFVLIENLFKKIFSTLLNIQLQTPFEIMEYSHAMEFYGSDKPDLRFENKLINLKDIFKNTQIEFVKNSLSNNKIVKGVIFDSIIDKKILEKANEEVKMQGGKGISYLHFENKNQIGGNFNKFSDDEKQSLSKLTNSNKFTLILICDDKKLGNELLGRVRTTVAKEIGIIPNDVYKFVWIVNWPLFDEEENTIVATHNPFTSVKDDQKESLLNVSLTDKEAIKKFVGRSYDIVLNGVEVGGGSIRLNNKELQKKVFNIIGMNEEEIESNFGWFLKAQTYGVPIHGGIALGLDRILQLLLKLDSIRETIAFPKSTSGVDEMAKAPIKKDWK